VTCECCARSFGPIKPRRVNQSPSPAQAAPFPSQTPPSVCLCPSRPAAARRSTTMQAAAARARRLLASPAASGIQGALTASNRGRAAGAELLLLPHLDNGFPASPSSPHHGRSFSTHLPREFPSLESIQMLVVALLFEFFDAAFRRTGRGHAGLCAGCTISGSWSRGFRVVGARSCSRGRR
jgi:hypothetical protein